MSKISIYGKQQLDRELDENKDLSVAFMRMGIKKLEKDKSDDSWHYKLENFGEIIIKQEDKVFKGAKDLFKAKLRSRMWALHQDLGITEDFEMWRERFKSNILRKIDDIYVLLGNKD